MSLTTLITITKESLTGRAVNTALSTVAQIKPTHTPTNGGIKAVIFCGISAIAIWLLFGMWCLWHYHILQRRLQKAHERQVERLGGEEAEISMETLTDKQDSGSRNF